VAFRVTRALAHRNYRLFFYGQSVSLVGTWITRVAISWLVYRLTGSKLLLGIVSFAGQIPTLLLAPLAGVVVDRHNRRRILIWTQAGSLAQSVLLAVLTLLDLITVPQLVVLQLVQGVINAFDTPARQALVVEMVTERSDVPNAIALNSSMVNGSRVIGPAVGGVIIAAVGEGWCFAIDAVSYVGVLISLAMMRLEPRPHPPGMPLLHDLRSGFRYVRDSVPIRSGLILLAVVSTAGVPYTVLMPAVVAETLGGGPDLLGWLMGASGAGALAGALYLANRHTVVGLGRVILIGALTFGASLVAFSSARTVWLAAPLPCARGRGIHRPGRVHQHHHPDHRGRTVSRACHGLLHHGVLRLGSGGQSHRRRRCHVGRRDDDNPAGRVHLHRCRAVVCFATAGAPSRNSPDLHHPWHHRPARCRPRWHGWMRRRI